MAGTGITWAFGEVTDLKAAFKIGSLSEKKLKDLDGKPVEMVYRGEISVKMSSNTSGGPPGSAGKTVVAYPANLNATRIPLIGEHLILFQGPGNQLGPAGTDPKTGVTTTGNTFDLEWYYLDALALQGSVHLNTNPGANVGSVSKADGTPDKVVDGEKTSTADSYESTIAGNPVTDVNTDPEVIKSQVPIKTPEVPTVLSPNQIFHNGKTWTMTQGTGGMSKNWYWKDDKGDTYVKIPNGNIIKTTKDISVYTGLTMTQSESVKTEPDPKTGETTTDSSTDTGGTGTDTKKKKDQKDNPAGSNSIDSLPGYDFKEQSNVNNLQPFEGDVLMQGRFGQSIRFGSGTTIDEKSKTEKRYQKQPSWKTGVSGEQGPIIIMRAGPAPSEKNENNDYIIEQVNSDLSSIWICAGQEVPITLASGDFDALSENHAMGDSQVSAGGTTINATHCNASGAATDPVPAYGPDNPIPTEVEELPLVPGMWPKYNTRKATIMGEGKLRIIGGWPFFENICKPVLDLLAAAAADGHNLKLNSGYRGIMDVVTVDEETGKKKKWASGQLPLRKKAANDRSWRTQANMDNTKSPLWKASSSKFSPATAPPGKSKHQNGIAIDINTSSKTRKGGTYHWLCYNAYKYGFIRTVSSEEWHFEYRPGSKTFDKVRPNNTKWHGHSKGHPHNV